MLSSDDKPKLRSMIIESLSRQGFVIQDSRLLPPAGIDKDRLRELHATAVQHKQARSQKGLIKHESILLKRLAEGQNIDPEAISPRLVEVIADSEDELLFRYAALHWSIPVSSGYGAAYDSS